MGFLTPMLLAGSLLVAVPVALHLAMRRQPQRHTFPALRFVRARRESNRRKMRFRHILLLALRAALIAGFSVALARPTLVGSQLHGKAGAPLAVALVIDNGPSMEYLHENRTRLEQAAAMAADLASELPETCSVGVLDRGRSLGGFVADTATALARLRNLATTSSPRPLEEIVREAITLVAQRQEDRQEVFLFTNMSKASLDLAALERVAEALDEASEVQLYLVDVGIPDPRNRALGELKLRRDILTPGEPIRIDLDVHSINLAGSTLLEFYVNDPSEGPVKRDQQMVDLTGSDQRTLSFHLTELPLGTHQGSVRIAASDPLPADNIRYFSLLVQPAANILLAGDSPQSTRFVRKALSPTIGGQRNAGLFQCNQVLFQDLAATELDDYQAVGLLDPPAQLAEDTWNRLADFAEAGGGVGIFLGHNASPPSRLSEGAARRLLPGTLRRRSRDRTLLQPTQFDHRALGPLADYAQQIPWQIFPVLEFWEFGQLAPEAQVIAPYANGQPALVGSALSDGRVLTMTTPFSDPLQPAGREPWNLLPTGSGSAPWPFLLLCNGIFSFLSQDAGHRLQFQAGETVLAPLPPGWHQSVHQSAYVLHRPDGQAIRQALPPGDQTLQISTADLPGNYRLTAGGKARILDLGFSVNGHLEESLLERVTETEILETLPSKRVHLASTLEDARRSVDIGRSGRELFEWMILVVLCIWAGEYLLASRFYTRANR